MTKKKIVIRYFVAMLISGAVAAAVLLVKHHLLMLFFFVLVAVPYEILSVKPKKKHMLEKFIDMGFLVVLIGIFLIMPAIISDVDEYVISYARLLAIAWFCATALFMSKDAIRAAKELDEGQTG